MNNLEWAMTYHMAGWSIFPCKDKEPYHELLKATGYVKQNGSPTNLHMWQVQPNEGDIIKWFEMDPNAQIGLACGSLSGVTVIDIDTKQKDPLTGKKIPGKENVDDIFSVLCKAIPIALASRTGSGGYHVFCKFVDVKNTQGRAHPQIDIKSQGGYVILPPSKHESGNTYAWLPGYEWGNKELPAFPLNLGQRRDAIVKGGDKKKWKDMLDDTLVGDRHDALLRIAGFVSNFIRSEPELAYGLLSSFNAVYLKPPKGEDEVLKIFNDIYEKNNKHRKYGQNI
jgi:hypothetical protein